MLFRSGKAQGLSHIPTLAQPSTNPRAECTRLRETTGSQACLRKGVGGCNDGNLYVGMGNSSVPFLMPL